MSQSQTIAVVIDADNTQASKIGDVLQELSNYGRILVKRAYGNWKKPHLEGWEAELKRLAIRAEQQFDYVAGKNATDMALVIGTMELLYTHSYDIFVIVSSDSDYTPLAIKLRESGVVVMGVGVCSTPESFQNACDKFLFLERFGPEIQASREAPQLSPAPKLAPVLQKLPQREPKTAILAKTAGTGGKAAVNVQPVSVKEKPKPKEDAPSESGIEEVHRLLRAACAEQKDQNGFVPLCAAGTYLRKGIPNFDCRRYGYKKLTDLVAGFPRQYQLKQGKQNGATVVVGYRCLK